MQALTRQGSRCRHVYMGAKFQVCTVLEQLIGLGDVLNTHTENNTSHMSGPAQEYIV